MIAVLGVFDLQEILKLLTCNPAVKQLFYLSKLIRKMSRICPLCIALIALLDDGIMVVQILWQLAIVIFFLELFCKLIPLLTRSSMYTASQRCR